MNFTLLLIRALKNNDHGKNDFYLKWNRVRGNIRREGGGVKNFYSKKLELDKIEI